MSPNATGRKRPTAGNRWTPVLALVALYAGSHQPILQAQERSRAGDTLRPYTVAPQLMNSAEIAAALERSYPPELREGGIEGTVVLWVQIDTDGDVTRAAVWESSGYGEFDQVATSVASQMRFIPAQSNAGPVSVSITVPVDFKLRRGGDPRPELVAYDTKPTLRNADEANRVLEALYPRNLKTSKIGGHTVLWLYIDEDGNVTEHRVKESSGYGEFDRAAELTSRVMEFRPAQASGQPVGVWSQVIFTFLPEGGSTVKP